MEAPASPLPFLRCPCRCNVVGLMAEFPPREGSDFSHPVRRMRQLPRRLLRRDVDRSVLLTCRRPAPGRQGLNGGPSSRRPGKPADGKAPAMAGNRWPPNGCMADRPRLSPGQGGKPKSGPGQKSPPTRAPQGDPGDPARSQGAPQGALKEASRSLLGPEDNRPPGCPWGARVPVAPCGSSRGTEGACASFRNPTSPRRT
jgi:hypothetical protein